MCGNQKPKLCGKIATPKVSAITGLVLVSKAVSEFGLVEGQEDGIPSARVRANPIPTTMLAGFANLLSATPKTTNKPPTNLTYLPKTPQPRTFFFYPFIFIF